MALGGAGPATGPATGPASAPAVLAPAALGHGSPTAAEASAAAARAAEGTAAEAADWNAEVDRLAAQVRESGFEGSHLAGYSMGGRLALGLLVRHPGLFRSATLIGASPGLADPAERESRARWDEGWARLLDEEGLDSFVAAWESLPLFASQDRLPHDVQARQHRIRRAHDPARLARSLRSLGLARMPDYRPRLPELDLPVRLVVGERDAKFREIAAGMAERLPRATVTVVADAGHNVVLEHPSEIAGLLREDMSA